MAAGVGEAVTTVARTATAVWLELERANLIAAVALWAKLGYG
ncbi:hypothetical protein [Streptomyces collinus]